MKFKLQHEELGEQEEIEILCPLWFGPVEARQAGKPLARSAPAGTVLRGQNPYQVMMRDGSVRNLIIRSNFLDPVPAVYLDKDRVLLTRPLHLLESVFAVLPVGMFLGHGAPAVILGFLLISTNFKVLRMNLHATLRWVIVYGLSIVFYLAFIWTVHVFRR